MKNIHPSQVIGCTETDVNKALRWLLTKTPTPKRHKAIKAAAAMIYGHETRSLRYPIKAHLMTSLGQFGVRNGEAKKFLLYSAKCFNGRLMYSCELAWISRKLVKYYLTQLATYSDITKLIRLMENYSNAKK